MPKLKNPTASFGPGTDVVPLRTSEPTATTLKVLVKVKGLLVVQDGSEPVSGGDFTFSQPPVDVS